MLKERGEFTMRQKYIGTVANKRCSMACAIREAYAATLTVVILVKGQEYPNNE
jgi:hypothetical protein